MKCFPLLTAACAALAACQVMPPKDFTVHTVPEGADITINGKPFGTSPATGKVDQDKSLGILAQKEGYEVAGATVPTSISKWRTIWWTEHSPKSRYIEQDEITIPLTKVPTLEDYKPTELPPYEEP